MVHIKDWWWYDDESPYSPVISGGLVATTRSWWQESGGFDPGMHGWGSLALLAGWKTSLYVQLLKDVFITPQLCLAHICIRSILYYLSIYIIYIFTSICFLLLSILTFHYLPGVLNEKHSPTHEAPHATLQIYQGGENTEQPIRTWLCGGLPPGMFIPYKSIYCIYLYAV